VARNRLLLGAKALLYAVAVHAVLAVALGLTLHIGGAPVAKPPPAPRAGTVVQAAVVDAEAMNRALAQIAAEEEQRRLAAAERERVRLEAEQRAAAEAKAAAEAEAAAKAKAAAEEEARKKAAEEERRKAAEAEAAKAKAAAEAKAAAKAQAAAEEERKKREAEERKIRTEALAAVGERMAFIKRKVGENWIRPRDAKSGLRAEFVVKIAAGGRVEVVTLRKSSGDGIFDRNAQAAIFKSSPLPIPDDPRYQRHYREGFVFIFDPERL